MRQQKQRNAVVVIGSFALAAAIVFAPKSAALPGAGLGSGIARPASQVQNEPPRTDDPAIVVEQGFEQMIGRELNRREAQQLKNAIRELQIIQAAQERPQKASIVGDVADFFGRNQFLPVFCFYGKGSIAIPNLGSVNVGGAGISAERTPCLLTNSINPLAWKVSKFRSYVMKGLSGTIAGSAWGGLSVGISGGIYMGPYNTTKPFIGTYGFARIILDRGALSAHVLGAFSKTEYGPQGMIMIGGQAGLGWDAVLRFVKILPKVDPATNTASVAGVKVEMGAWYDVKEFPWFERLVKGWNPVAAFADMDEYIAANN